MYASLRRPIDGQPIHGVITNVGDSISTAHDEAVFHLTYTFVLNSTTYKGTSRHTGYAYDARSRIGVTFLSTNPSISEFTGSHGAFGSSFVLIFHFGGGAIRLVIALESNVTASNR